MQGNVWTKSSWEKTSVSFDASKTIPDGDSISTATVTIYDSDGTDVSSSMVVGSASISGTDVTQKIQAGEDANDYTCLLRLTTAAGEQIEDTLTIRVRDIVGAAGLGTLIELPEIKSWLDLKTTDDDDFLEEAIRNWSNTIEERLGRTILSASYTDEAHDGGKKSVILRNFPVTAISSITADGSALDTDDYKLNAKSGIIRLKSGYNFAGGPGDILVSYTAGYTTAPGDMKRAVKQLAALEYYLSGRGRKALAKRSESTGDGSTTYERGPEDQEKIVRGIVRRYGRR